MFGVFDPNTRSGAKNDSALAPSGRVLIITTKFGEFLPNRLGGVIVIDGQTDEADYNIPRYV